MIIMFKTSKEGLAKIIVPKEEKISKELPVFYNPVMKFNRDMSILLINSVEMDNMQIADPLAGSGVRGARFVLELKEGKIKSLNMNDMSSDAIKLIEDNMKNNHADSSLINIYNMDANDFILQSKGFDYIDIDPFGTPNPFLDSAIKRLSRCGILAVTATDTSALCGTFPKACRRKYWADPTRSIIMHEAGLRILIRKVQLIGAQYDRALTPIFSYSKDHYMRIFFRSKKGKQRVDSIVSKHRTAEYMNEKPFGPIWTGQLHDTDTIVEMIRNCADEKNRRFLELILGESKIDDIFFYDIHTVMKKYKINCEKKKHVIIKNLRDMGKLAFETHFIPTGIKTDASLEEFIDVLKK